MDDNFKDNFLNDDEAQAVILGQFDFMDLETEENTKMKRPLKGQENMFDSLNQINNSPQKNNLDKKTTENIGKNSGNVLQKNIQNNIDKNKQKNMNNNKDKISNHHINSDNKQINKLDETNKNIQEKSQENPQENSPQNAYKNQNKFNSNQNIQKPDKVETLRRIMKQTTNQNPPQDGLITKPLEEVMHDSMIPYTEHVVMDRALPRVEDGLKPVQRRILYTMYEDDLFPDKPYRKSATVVGDCLGRYHPHGDTSVYDAMVRMAQDFMLREPLVDGHGNFGSMDGDSAAAYRYTEAKLKPLALELLRDIDKNTVNWGLNFDDRRKEPDTLPGRFPNMLVNGAYGIAVGLATNIPPHNLAETIDAVCAYIDKPSINLAGIMKHLKGPDFPTGGILIVGEELKKAYETGKGKIIIRAKAFIEESGDKKNIVITELPYQTNKAQLLQKIAELKEANKEKYAAIAEIRDESDRNGLRAVIRLKKDCNAKAILESLYKQTGLQVTFGINLVAIAGGKPKCMTLLEIISYYVEYQRQVVYRRTKFDLDACKDRAHILEGLLIAIKNIDEVIKIIKKSQNTNDAKQNLKAKFFLSEKQAQAILDMRLARLVNLEVNKIKEELAELKAKIAELTEIYNSKAKQLNVVKNELLEIKKQYKSPRRSKIVGEADVETVEEVEETEEVEKNYFLTISQNNTVKAIPEKNYNLSSKEFTENSTLNDAYRQIMPVKSSEKVLIFTNKGNCLKIDVKNIPEAKYRDKGTDFAKLSKFLEKDEKAVKIFNISKPQFELDNTELLFMTNKGSVKRSPLSEYLVAKSYFAAIKLKDEEVLDVQEYNKDSSILMLTKNGMVLNFESDLPSTGRISGGIKGINLDDGDVCIFASQVKRQGALTALTTKGYAKNVPVGEFEVSSRNRKGLKVFNPKDVGQIVAASFGMVPPSFIIKHEGAFMVLKSIYIPYDNRTGKGKQIYKEDDIKSATPIV